MIIKKKFETKKIFYLGIIVFALLMLTGCTSNNEDQNNQDADETDVDDDSDKYAVNVDKNLVGNWTWVNGSTNGEPVTYINSGWELFNKDGTWAYSYDRGYTIQTQSGTFQAKDGQLYRQTSGSEVSDWSSQDSYEIIGNTLIISSDGGESRYGKE